MRDPVSQTAVGTRSQARPCQKTGARQQGRSIALAREPWHNACVSRVEAYDPWRSTWSYRPPQPKLKSCSGSPSATATVAAELSISHWLEPTSTAVRCKCCATGDLCSECCLGGRCAGDFSARSGGGC